MFRGLLLLCVLANPSRAAQTETTQHPLVHGEDGRREFFETPTAIWQERMRQNSVAIVDFDHIAPSDREDEVTLPAPTLGTLDKLCPGQRFSEQPSPVDCSGVYVGGGLVLTSAHCLHGSSCEGLAFVFGYQYQSPGVLNRIRRTDVFRCKRVIDHHLDSANSDVQVDYVWIELEDNEVPFPPGTAASEFLPLGFPPNIGDEAIVIGHPGGIPAKWLTGGTVTFTRDEQDYFSTSADTFSGSSGSGVYNNQGELIGVFVRGQSDYDQYDVGCRQVRYVALETAGDEQATHVRAAVDGLCRVSPEIALCDHQPEAFGCAISGLSPLSTEHGKPPWLFAITTGVLGYRVRRSLKRRCRN